MLSLEGWYSCETRSHFLFCCEALLKTTSIPWRRTWEVLTSDNNSLLSFSIFCRGEGYGAGTWVGSRAIEIKRVWGVLCREWTAIVAPLPGQAGQESHTFLIPKTEEETSHSQDIKARACTGQSLGFLVCRNANHLSDIKYLEPFWLWFPSLPLWIVWASKGQMTFTRTQIPSESFQFMDGKRWRSCLFQQQQGF